MPIRVYDTATIRPVAVLLRPGKTPSATAPAAASAMATRRRALPTSLVAGGSWRPMSKGRPRGFERHAPSSQPVFDNQHDGIVESLRGTARSASSRA